MQRVQALAVACLSADAVAYRMVEVNINSFCASSILIILTFAHQAYLNFQLGLNALNDARHSEAADHFAVAINTDTLSSKQETHFIWEDLTMVGRYDTASHASHAKLGPCAAFRMGHRVLVENGKPETVLCTPSVGQISRRRHIVPSHDGHER